MLRRGGRLLAALFAAVCAVSVRRRSRRVLATIVLVAVFVATGQVVLTRAERALHGQAFASTVTSSTYGVLPLSRPAAVALPPGRRVARSVSLNVAAPSRRNAVIVGINHARGSRPLQGSIADATNVKNALLRYGFPEHNITMLTEGAATRTAILGALHSLAARTPSSGMAVFAVATHTRIRGGENKLVTSDGALIGAHELAAALGEIRAKTWVTLATCYAQGYALPGVVGYNRIATFGSGAHELTYQIGDAGSYMVINMVKKAMLDGYAPRSIEESFAYARDTLRRTNPDRVPVIEDDIPGNVALGPVWWRMRAQAQPKRSDDGSWNGEHFTQTSSGAPGSAPEATPPPDDDGGGQSVIGVCGRYRYRCGSEGDAG